MTKKIRFIGVAISFFIFLFLILSCELENEKMKTENIKNNLDSSFNLRMLFMPSFCASAMVEIDVTPKKKTLTIAPGRYEYYINKDFLSFPKSTYTISEEDFDSLKFVLKGINLKKIKSTETVMVDGIGICLLYNNFVDSINIIEYHSPENSSVHHKISVAVLNLCLKYAGFDPTAKVIEDITRYFNDEIIYEKIDGTNKFRRVILAENGGISIRKIDGITNYFRIYNLSEVDEDFNYSSFFKNLPLHDTVIFNLSNLEQLNENFETNFVNYLNKNENCIIVVEDYLKYFKHKRSKRDYNFSFFINLSNYLSNSSFYDSNDSLVYILDSIKCSQMLAPFRRNGTPIPVPDAEID